MRIKLLVSKKFQCYMPNIGCMDKILALEFIFFCFLIHYYRRLLTMHVCDKGSSQTRFNYTLLLRL